MAIKVATFLGPGRVDARQTRRFQFGNYTTKPIRLAGVALFRWLCAEENIPDEVFVYGTKTSDWDLLHEFAAVPYYMPQFQAIGIRQAIEHNTLTQQHLDALGKFIQAFLGGIPVRCIMLPEQMGRSAQWSFFSVLQRQYQRGDELHVDISRDIWATGLFTTASMAFLTQARSIKGLYIAQPAATTIAGTPVMIIDDLNEVARWSSAVAIFRQNGLIGHLVELFTDVDRALGESIGEVNFAVETFQYEKIYNAYQNIKTRITALARSPHAGIAQFFSHQLIEELTWLDTGHLADWELEFARRALYSHNVSRAVSLTQEAVITAAIGVSEQRVDGNYRAKVRRFLLQEAQRESLFPVDPRPYIQLDVIRRALAGEIDARQSKAFQEVSGNSVILQRALERAISFAAVLVARFKRVPPM